jgi:predicted RNase H-like nuclease (RuvC/YqgF family)
VGIDPGATFGIALLGLDGRALSLHSTAGGFSDAAREIERRCTPSLVACDTNPAPEAAQRLASYFSCRLFVPRQSVREEEKRQVARKAGTENAHERDAYCAAVLAWRASQNKLRQIDAIGGLPHAEKEKVKHLLLRGVRAQDAFMMLREPEKEEEALGKAASAPKTVSPEELRQRLGALARENANLRLALERLEAEKAALLRRLRLLENGVRKSVVRDAEFRKLRFQLQQAVARLRRGLPASEPPGSDPTSRLAAGQKKRKLRGQRPARDKEPSVGGSRRAFAAQAAKPETSEGINSGKPQIDLERLVEEYRKGRSCGARLRERQGQTAPGK